jgi:hypothetical protein
MNGWHDWVISDLLPSLVVLAINFAMIAGFVALGAWFLRLAGADRMMILKKLDVGPENYIGEVGRCIDCGAPVSDYLCNPAVIEQRPDAEGWDWIVVCDNAHCEHHAGEGYFQNKVPWLAENSPSV